MAKTYNVFIQWHENTNNYRRFDGGLELRSRKQLESVELANAYAADWVWNYSDNYSYDGGNLIADNRGGEVAIDTNSNEPASYDFGDGTIYVAEVVE